MAKFGFRNHSRFLDFSSVPSVSSRVSPNHDTLVEYNALVVGRIGETSRNQAGAKFRKVQLDELYRID